MPDKQAFFDSAHCALEQESYRLLISPGGKLFWICFQKKRQDCLLTVFSGKINEDKINFSVSRRGVTIRLWFSLWFQTSKKNKQVVRLHFGGWIIYHPGGFSAEWICQLSVFVLKETLSQNIYIVKSGECVSLPWGNVTTSWQNICHNKIISEQKKKKSMVIFVCMCYTPPPKLQFHLLGWKLCK